MSFGILDFFSAIYDKRIWFKKLIDLKYVTQALVSEMKVNPKYTCSYNTGYHIPSWAGTAHPWTAVICLHLKNIV